MANINDQAVGHVYVDQLSKYENLTNVADTSIFYVKNSGIFVGSEPVANYINLVDLLTKEDASIIYQKKLTFDEVPTVNSSNPVKSSGIYSALEQKVDTSTKINGKTLDTSIVNIPNIYVGTCSTAAATAPKAATVEPFPLDENNKPLVGTIIAVKFANTNTYKTSGTTMTLNVNGTGAYPIYYNNAEIVSTTTANTLACGYKNRYIYYLFNGTQWVWLTASFGSNNTYSAMTQAEINAGTGTTGRTITPKMLRDNFYTETEVDEMINLVTDELTWQGI